MPQLTSSWAVNASGRGEAIGMYTPGVMKTLLPPDFDFASLPLPKERSNQPVRNRLPRGTFGWPQITIPARADPEVPCEGTGKSRRLFRLLRAVPFAEHNN